MLIRLRTGFAALFLAQMAVLSGCGSDSDPVGSRNPPPPPTDLAAQINLPPGFKIEAFASNITRPRSMALAEDGTVFVGSYFFTRGLTSPVYALRDTDGDFRVDEVHRLSNGFGTPNGVDYHDGTLYIVDEHRVVKVDDVLNHLDNPTFITLNSTLPTRAETEQASVTGHWWRYLRYGPDDRIYVTVGTRWAILVGAHTANDLADPEMYSTIMRMNPDGSGLEVFADGVRNSMGMDFHPSSGDLYFNDNGASWPFQDSRFYDIPADEMNRASTAGMDFGFPYMHGFDADPLIGGSAPPGQEPPAHAYDAHTAPLGLRFYTGTMFPERYQGAIFVAEHGTEASTPARADLVDGDRISVMFLDGAGNVTSSEVFASGFFQGVSGGGGTVYNRRPVDLLVLHDGSLLVTDDQAQAIYRISYDPS